MMNMKYKFLVLLLVFIFKCSRIENDIHGKWIIYQVENVDTDELIVIPMEEELKPFIEFKSSGLYNGHNAFGEQKGTWIMRDNKIWLYQNTDTTIMSIEELNTNFLTWSINKNKTKVRFFGKREVSGEN